MLTFDRRTIDSTGAFLVGQLEKLDTKIHDPLAAVTWQRDIDLRSDVTIADEVSSFTVSGFAMPGGMTPSGINWISNEANAISGPSVDLGKTPQPLDLWGAEIRYTIPELEKSQKLNQPIDQTKIRAMQLKHQMDIDQLVYVGDSFRGSYGLLNNTGSVTPYNVSNKAAGGTRWVIAGALNATPQEILNDVNFLIQTVWQQTGYALFPNRILLPPHDYNALASNTLAIGSSPVAVSILKFIRENNIASQSGADLQILPLKWCIGSGTGGTLGTLGTVDRMIAYVKDEDRVRFPMTTLSRTPLEYRSIWQSFTYYCRIGRVEFVYPETVAYADGL